MFEMKVDVVSTLLPPDDGCRGITGYIGDQTL